MSPFATYTYLPMCKMKRICFCSHYLSFLTNFVSLLCHTRPSARCGCSAFLAHLSRRLKGELIVYQSNCRLSGCVSVNIFKLEYLRNQWANRNEILSEPSLGWGIACIRFWARSDRNSGVHGNGLLPYGYNGENVVSTLAPSFLIGSSTYLQVTKTSITSRTSSKFGQIRPRTAELAALERLEKSP